MESSCYELKTIVKLKSIHCIDCLIIQRLEKAGLRSSSRISGSHFQQRKGKRLQDDSVFGVSLENETQSSEPYVVEGYTACLPKFFVMAITFLNNHVTCEGIFRKAGSINRQKTLRAIVSAGQLLPESTSPHDVAALLKQYLRELPDPLITNRLYPVFAEIIMSSHLSCADKEELILMTCLLLPERHLLSLKVLMQLLQKVSACSHSHSLMDSESLALVLSPNIMSALGGSSKKETVCLDIKTTTDITKILIDRASDICKMAKTSIDLSSTEFIADRVKSNNTNHTPWKGYVSDKLRGTWTRIKGKGPGLPRSDEETSLSKRPALEEEDPFDTVDNSTSLFGTAKRRRKKRTSVLDKKKRRGMYFGTPSSTPAKQMSSLTAAATPFTADRFTSACSSLHECCTVNEKDSTTYTKENVLSSSDELTTIVSGVTIGQRVRKRRQNERELPPSSSTQCVCSTPPMNQKLPVSQSDSRLFHGATPATSSVRRPKLKAIFRRNKATSEKRKGFIHEPGANPRPCTLSRKGKHQAVENEETQHLITTSTSSDEEDCDQLVHVFNGDTTATTRSSGVSTSGDNFCNSQVSLDETPPAFKSPGLLRKVASEITERFQYTPKQLVPACLSNNDSYLFAVEEDAHDESRSSPTLMNFKRGPLVIAESSSNILSDISNDECLSAYKSVVTPLIKPTREMSVASSTRSKSKTVAKVRSSPFFSISTTKSKRSGPKLSRRAKQYVVSPTQLDHCSKENIPNRQGMLVSEWIL